jgi:hypothetical protein
VAEYAGTSMRPRGAVTIGGDAAGAVVVDVVEVVDVDVVVVVVLEEDVVVEEGRALPDEPHAALAISSTAQALLRPRRRRTPS